MLPQRCSRDVLSVRPGAGSGAPVDVDIVEGGSGGQPPQQVAGGVWKSISALRNCLPCPGGSLFKEIQDALRITLP